VIHPATLAVFAAVLGACSLVALLARRPPAAGEEPALEAWALGGRRLGAVPMWLLLGGAIYTAYTFVAVPGLVYGVGGLGMFALPYTIVVYPLAFVLLPRLWTVAARNGCVTPADLVRARLSSPGLALAVALTGILATMPYIALQLLGLRAVLEAMGVAPAGLAGDLVLTLTFGVLAVATYRSGLRAPALISLLKGVLIFAVTLALVALAAGRLGGPGAIFAAAGPALAERSGGAGSLLLAPGMGSAYVTLAVGSALALVVYPHVLTCAFAARDADVLRRDCAALPAWTAVLGLLAMLGVAALAAGVAVPAGRGELAVPLLVDRLLGPAATGFALAALGVGALVPAAIMSVATATLFTRNVYKELLHPAASPEQEVQVARVVSVVVKLGALAFVLALRNQDAINLQLLGGVWILQTLPAVGLALLTRRLHRLGLLAGWAAGMVAGTALLAAGGFVSVVSVRVGGLQLEVYSALLALALNLAVAGALSPVLDRLGVPRGLDTTGTEQLAARRAPRDEWLGAR
jgi:SSS family solute:Na+ symporter